MASAADGEFAVVVEDLRLEVAASGVDIVDEVSFRIRPGQVLGLVGESGSGKTTVGLALLGHTRRGVRVAHGRISVAGHEMLSLPTEQRRVLRGAVVSYVPQDPGSALNPNLRIGKQIFEVLAYHDVGDDDASRHRRVAESLADVALPSDNEFLRRYPHQLSGGQQQRVGLAMAFACRPRVLVLDEPTTGLDVTTQAHVLGTVRDLCGTHGVAALYVSHDLAVISDLADRVALMYSGRLVEVGPKVSFFQGSAHPYARRLIEAIPEMSGDHELLGIPGSAAAIGAVLLLDRWSCLATTLWLWVLGMIKPPTSNAEETQMGCDVYANGDEIACKSGIGKVIAAFPDVSLVHHHRLRSGSCSVSEYLLFQGHEERQQDGQD